MTRLTLLIAFLCLIGCSGETKKDVGDIFFDKKLDDPSFKVCDETNIKQYYIRGSMDTAPGFVGEKRGLERAILSEYSYPVTQTENGYLTLRFVVNCEGQTGWIRVEEMDFEYKTKSFDTQIRDQLIGIIQGLEGWIPRKSGEKNLDFYQYLTFKIEKGQIVKILP